MHSIWRKVRMATCEKLAKYVPKSLSVRFFSHLHDPCCFRGYNFGTAYQKLGICSPSLARSSFFLPITRIMHANYVVTLAPRYMYTYIRLSVITQLGCGHAVIYLSVQRAVAINGCLSSNHLLCGAGILMTGDFTENLYQVNLNDYARLCPSKTSIFNRTVFLFLSSTSMWYTIYTRHSLCSALSSL